MQAPQCGKAVPANVVTTWRAPGCLHRGYGHSAPRPSAPQCTCWVSLSAAGAFSGPPSAHQDTEDGRRTPWGRGGRERAAERLPLRRVAVGVCGWASRAAGGWPLPSRRSSLCPSASSILVLDLRAPSAGVGAAGGETEQPRRAGGVGSSGAGRRAEWKRLALPPGGRLQGPSRQRGGTRAGGGRVPELELVRVTCEALAPATLPRPPPRVL